MKHFQCKNCKTTAWCRNSKPYCRECASNADLIKGEDGVISFDFTKWNKIRFFGFFNSETDEKPSYYPPMICLFCFKGLTEDNCKTISLMKTGDNKSYFYRVHKECYEKATDEEITLYESSLIDNL